MTRLGWADAYVKAVNFVTHSKVNLPITLCNEQIVMQFPIYDTQPAQAPKALLDALGLKQVEKVVYNAEVNVLMIVIKDAQTLQALQPDFKALIKSHDSILGVLVTAPGFEGFDIYSRFFWPWSGPDEVPVTGATHTFLAKYWAERLGKTQLTSYQCSKRGGFMDLEILDKELLIKSEAVIVLEGELLV